MTVKFFCSAASLSVCLLGLPLFAANLAGVPNFDKVDQHVYRGAQPTDEGFGNLAKLGVKVVLDLRETDGRSAAEKQVVTAAGMRYVNVPMTGLTPPTEGEITRILALLEDGTAGPVFVHCKRGADRTGAVIAAYQIDFLKWDNARAFKDAKAHGMGRFQLPRQSYVRSFRPRTVDANAATKPAGDAPAPLVPAVISAGVAKN
jgi:tyrosine-protein phosphatase SIW14